MSARLLCQRVGLLGGVDMCNNKTKRVSFMTVIHILSSPFPLPPQQSISMNNNLSAAVEQKL